MLRVAQVYFDVLLAKENMLRTAQSRCQATVRFALCLIATTTEQQRLTTWSQTAMSTQRLRLGLLLGKSAGRRFGARSIRRNKKAPRMGLCCIENVKKLGAQEGTRTPTMLLAST